MNELRFSEEFPHYVYVHYRNDTGRPFYVGIGKKYKARINTTHLCEYQRAYETDRSDLWTNIVNKHGYTVEIFMDHLTHKEAVEKEKELIRLYGRIDQRKDGILANHTDGGEGNVGLVVKEAVKQYFKKLYTIPLEKSIEMYSYPEPNTGCWLWAGVSIRDKAYVSIEGKCYPAHLKLYEYYNNIKVPKGKFVLRSCKNSYCVNPDHLYLGDGTETKKAHRSTWRQHLSVINEEIVKKIRALREDGKRPIEIVNELDLTPSIVHSVLKGKTWKWVV